MFPLPLPPAAPPPRRSDFGHRSVFDRMRKRWLRARLARHSVQVLNICAAGQARGSGAAPVASKSASSGPPSRAQASVQERIFKRVAAYGAPPSLTPLEAVNELLRTSSIDEPRPSSLATFSWDKLRLLSPDWPVRPQDIADVAPTCVAEVFRNPQSVRLSEEELEHLYHRGDLVKPYWDPHLRDDKVMRKRFFATLRERGLLSFR